MTTSEAEDRRPRARTKLARAGLSAVLALLGCRTPSSSSTVVDPPLVLAPTSPGQTLPPESVKARLVAELGFTSRGGTVACAYTVLAQDDSAAYLWVRCEERTQDGDRGSGLSLPVVLALDGAGIVAVRCPRDGDLFADDVEAMFPRAAVQQIFADAATLAERDAALEAALASATPPPPR